MNEIEYTLVGGDYTGVLVIDSNLVDRITYPKTDTIIGVAVSGSVREFPPEPKAIFNVLKDGQLIDGKRYAVAIFNDGSEVTERKIKDAIRFSQAKPIG